MFQKNEDCILMKKEENLLLFTHFMPRPRIDALLEKATKNKLVYIIAGAGYGKTQTVRNYLDMQQEAVIRWVQMSESDNLPSRFWEHLIHTVSSDNPELAAKMQELGFPETAAHFKQFAEILKNTEYRAQKTFFVLDDFHLIESEQITTFVERCTLFKISGVCVIIISKKEPGKNMIPLLAKGEASVITEDAFRFTEDEIAMFLEFKGISFSNKDLPKFLQVTEGWALAIQFLSLVLKKSPQNIDSALNSMKQNVFKLFEMEAFNDVPENIQKNLVKLTLFPGLPFVLLYEFEEIISFMQNDAQLTSFILFDSLHDDYKIHPIYLDFLKSKQHMLSDEEKLDVYCRTAEWCVLNKFYTDAMNYFAKSRQYDRMVETLFSHPFKLPRDKCEYFLNIFENIPTNDEDKNIILLKSYFIPLMLVGLSRYEEAEKLTLDVVRKWENVNAPLAHTILRGSYSNLAYIDMYTCTAMHQYNAPKYIKKSIDHAKVSAPSHAGNSSSFFVPHVRSYACLVGEGAEFSAFDKFLEATKQTAIYISETHHSMFYGYDDLVSAEIAYYKNQLDLAKKHAHNAVAKAREKNQHSIEAMAKQYLLRIAVFEGDAGLAKEILRQMRKNLNAPNFWNGQLLYDISAGLFYSLIGLPNMSPSWMTLDEKETASEVHMPIAELVVCLNTCIALKKYDQALTVLYNSYPRAPQDRFIFSELQLALIAAVAKVKNNDIFGAMEDFERAYEMSFNGSFETPFIELGKNLHQLTAVALTQEACKIPDEWLKKIDRKASVYAKKAAVVMNAFKGDEDIKNEVHLSEREQEVLKDLHDGLSRDEIAENRYLSINTVKKILQSIYIKLDANNNVDAIRIAIERKLL